MDGDALQSRNPVVAPQAGSLFASAGGKTRPDGLQALATIAVLAAALVPFVVLAAFNQAAADDFCFAGALEHQSFWAAQLDWYRHWTGRFVSTLLVSAVTAGGIPSAAFVAVPLINIATLFAALAFLGHALLAGLASRVQIVTAAGAATAVYLASMPDVAEGVYWASGSLTYTLPAILLLVALAAAVRAHDASTAGSRRIFTSLACTCVFVASGASETLAAVAVAGAGLAAWSALRRSRSALPFLPYALAAIAAGAAVAAAPGLDERMAGFARPTLGEGLSMLLKILYYHVLGWAIFGLLLAIAGWDLLLRWAAARSQRRDAPPPSHPLAVACGLAVVVLAVVAPAAVIRGAVPDRVLDVAYLTVLLGLPYLSFCTLAWLAASRGEAAAGMVAAIQGDVPLRRALNYGALAVLVLMLANSAGLQAAYADLAKGRAAAYARSWQARYAQLEGCGRGECRVAGIAAPPASLAVGDLSRDPQDWKNRCVADLYGLQAVSLDGR